MGAVQCDACVLPAARPREEGACHPTAVTSHHHRRTGPAARLTTRSVWASCPSMLAIPNQGPTFGSAARIAGLPCPRRRLRGAPCDLTIHTLVHRSESPTAPMGQEDSMKHDDGIRQSRSSASSARLDRLLVEGPRGP
jgi:hypothetical protein